MRRWKVEIPCTVVREFDGSSEFESERHVDQTLTITVDARDESEARSRITHMFTVLISGRSFD